MAKLMVLPNGKRVVLDWNVEGQPISEAVGLLRGFLGALASHCQSFPINFEKWPLVPKELKDHAWTNTIQQKFQVSTPEHRKYIFDKIGKNWKDNCLRLYDEFYNELHDQETNLQMRPEGIPVDQWAGYLQYRSKEKTKEMCAKNATNREMQTIPHTLGSKSIARRRHELQIETGRSYGRAKMFAISHTKADGSFVNEEAREINEQINAYSDGSVSSEEAFSKVFPKEHPGRVRDFGLGPCPSQIFGTTYVRSSMPTSSNVEVDALKLELESSNKKIKALEESNKEMSEQVAFLMQTFGHQMNADSYHYKKNYVLRPKKSVAKIAKSVAGQFATDFATDFGSRKKTGCKMRIRSQNWSTTPSLRPKKSVANWKILKKILGFQNRADRDSGTPRWLLHLPPSLFLLSLFSFPPSTTTTTTTTTITTTTTTKTSNTSTSTHLSQQQNKKNTKLQPKSTEEGR